MKNVNPMSTQGKVRGALQNAAAPISIKQVRDLIGLSGTDGYNRVARAIKDLLGARQCERTERGFYRFLDVRPESDYCKMQRVMQRVMWMRSKNRNPFTARRIAELSGCSLYTAQRYIAWLLEKGVLKHDGRAQVATKAYAPLYLGEDAYLATDDWPVMREWNKSRELAAVMNEMREVAARFFSVETIEEKALAELKNAAGRLGELVDLCGNLKRNR